MGSTPAEYAQYLLGLLAVPEVEQVQGGGMVEEQVQGGGVMEEQVQGDGAGQEEQEDVSSQFVGAEETLGDVFEEFDDEDEGKDDSGQCRGLEDVSVQTGGVEEGGSDGFPPVSDVN